MRRAVLLSGLMACTGAGTETAVDTAVDTDGPTYVDPLSLSPTERGPWRVGFRAWEVTYEPTPGVTREILFNVWYPTEDTEGEAVRYSGFQPAEGVLGEASLAPTGLDGYPVMAYSHGDQAWGASSADLMGWFASHGWVAVAPDHTGNLLIDNVQPTPAAHWYHRPMDISASLDVLEDLPAEDPLAGVTWTDRVVLTGHSRGTYTVWSAAGASYDPAGLETSCPTCTEEETQLFTAGLEDDRLVAFVPMAGTIRRQWFGDEGHRDVRGPFLALTGTADPVGQQAQFDSMDGIDFTWVDIEGGCHQTFALGACDTLDTARGFQIVDTYALAFARLHALDDTSEEVVGIVDGTVEVAPEVRMERKTASP